MFTKKKTSELGDQENLMCSISPFSKITQSTKKTAQFLHSRKCKQFKKKVDMKHWLTAYSVMIFQKA